MYSIIFIAALFFSNSVHEHEVYTDLCQALEKPLKVFYLKLNTCSSMQNCDLVDIRKLTNLETLEISECPSVMSLPDEISSLKNLRAITFNWNGIDHSESIKWSNEFKKLCLLDSLEFLDLSYYNRIGHLPSEVGCLKNLKILNLRMTMTLSLPQEIGLLNNLEVLDLSMTKIRDLPEELANIKSLKKIYLIDTDLSDDKKKRSELIKMLSHCELIFEPK